MNILAIETSCDDTGIAILEASGFKKPFFKVLSNIVSSQVEIHRKYGGVYPMLAKREHQRNLVSVLTNTLKKAKLLEVQNVKFKTQNHNPKLKTIKEILEREEFLYKKLIVFLQKYEKPDIDLIAVTNGPGLEPCLWVGVNFAKSLAYFWDLPVVSVNHVKAHIFVNMFRNGKIKELTKKDFPAVCLIVSGGHTLLFLMKNFGEYEILGETRDDAAGECFDKTARILGLGYPGGPAIAEQAWQWKSEIRNPKSEIKLPRPMIHSKDYDFSFSGLKTAVLYTVRKKYSAKALLRSAFSRTTEGRQYIKQMCAEIQQAIIDVLIKKTIRAAKDYNAKTIILGGGVAANEELRKQFAEKIQHLTPNTQYLIPNTQLCTDNALMVAVAGYFRYKNRKIENWKKIKVDANLKIRTSPSARTLIR